jgi:hypothetical protein
MPNKDTIQLKLTGKEQNSASDFFGARFDILYESNALYYKDTPITLEVVKEL